MLHQHLKLEERRLMAREGAHDWEFARQREFRWLALLAMLGIAVALAFALTLWLGGAYMLP